MVLRPSPAGDFRVAAQGELRSLEVVANNHWIERIATPSGWELAVKGTARVVLAHRNPAKERTVQALSDLYFRRPSIAGSSFLSLLVKANLAVDLREGSAVSGAVGVEHLGYEVAAVLHAGFSSVRWADAQGASVGALVAGGLEPRLDRLRAAMFGGAHSVEVRLDNLRLIEAQLARLEVHRGDPFPSLRRLAEITLEQDVWRMHLARGRCDIAVELAQYLTDRDAFFRYEGKVNRSTYDREPETYGPLPARLREAARSQIARQ